MIESSIEQPKITLSISAVNQSAHAQTRQNKHGLSLILEKSNEESSGDSLKPKLQNSILNSEQKRGMYKLAAPFSSEEELEMQYVVKEMTTEFHTTPGSLKCTRAILSHQDVYKFDDGEINLKSVHGKYSTNFY